MSFEGVWETVKEHKVLFGLLALAVLVFFLWPSKNGGGGSSITAQEEQAIATASQANAAITSAQIRSQTELGLSHDQLSAYGIGAATKQSIDLADNAAKTQQTQIAADVQDAQTNAALLALQSHDSTAISLAKLTNDSQDSAQKFLSDLEHAGLNTPTYATAGGTFGATDTQSVNAQQQVTNAEIAAKQQVAQAQIASNERINAANLAAQQAMQQNQINANWLQQVTQLGAQYGINVGAYTQQAQQAAQGYQGYVAGGGSGGGSQAGYSPVFGHNH